MVDMAHFAGLVAAGEHPSPFGHAHVVTTTTHKTLRGPRGGMVLTDDEAIAKKINSAVFPGLQGGPLMHVIAAKAVAFGEALQPDFKTYARAVIANAKALAGRLKERGADLVSGGTDTHLALVDLRPLGVTGKDADEALERAAITCNKNGIPFDPLPPVKTSGIRVGSPAGTTRGFGVAEFRDIADMVADVLEGLRANGEEGNAEVEAAVQGPRPRALRALPDLPGAIIALPVLRPREQPGEGQPSHRGRLGDPPPPPVRGLRRPLHHLRAHPAARADRGQVREPARAVRPHQARTLDRHRLPQAPGPARADRAPRLLDPAPDRDERRERDALGRIGEMVMEGLKALDPVAYIRFASSIRTSARPRISRISRAR